MDVRNKLKKCQPYFIDKELIPKLYFSEEIDNNGQNIEQWIFFYAFVRKLSDTAIGIRLGYTRQTINIRTKKIINRNLFIIEDFLAKYLTSN